MKQIGKDKEMLEDLSMLGSLISLRYEANYSLNVLPGLIRG